MTRVFIRSVEWYPVYISSAADLSELFEDDTDTVYEVDEVTQQRWARAAAAFEEAQAEMHELVDPTCPECPHRTSRHQVHADGREYGCLSPGCGCEHGLTPGIQARLDAAWAEYDANTQRIIADAKRRHQERQRRGGDTPTF